MCCLREVSGVENKLYGYADDSTLVTVVPSPGDGTTEAVSESMNRDLNSVSVCVTRGE